MATPGFGTVLQRLGRSVLRQDGAGLTDGQLLGLFGMLLAIPLASTAKILFEDYVRPMAEDVADLTRVRRRSEAEGALPPAPNP